MVNSSKSPRKTPKAAGASSSSIRLTSPSSAPTELGDVADHYEELQKLGVDVYSVSTDTHFTHKAWHSSS